VINWTVEKPLVETECALYGTNLLVPVLMAIRTAENGSSAGREYGVLSVSAPTYAEQLHMAALTVLHRLWSYPGNPLTTTPDHQLVVSTNWIAYFASIWAPSGVANDPNNLNANWVKDFTAAYNGFIAALLPAAP
jgi:hypothetical protein